MKANIIIQSALCLIQCQAKGQHKRTKISAQKVHL